MPRSRFNPSMREVVLTVSPSTAYFFFRGAPSVPAKASPVWTAMPMASGPRSCASQRRFSPSSAACMATAVWAACQQCSGSSSGAP